MAETTPARPEPQPRAPRIRPLPRNADGSTVRPGGAYISPAGLAVRDAHGNDIDDIVIWKGELWEVF